MTEDTQFLGDDCGIECRGDTRNIMTQCRACQRTHCNDCMDELGQCIKCAEKKLSKT